MPLDAVTLSALRNELSGRITGLKIDKVFQPEKDELILALRGASGSCRLLLSANQANARICLTEAQRENPAVPPMFCMLMRKYIGGGVIRSISQPPLERVVELELDATDEMGILRRRKLIIELIGRQSNIILTDEDGRITDAIHRVDGDIATGKRQILPGMFYRPPEPQVKVNPLYTEPHQLSSLLASAPTEAAADRWLLDTFLGLSPVVCRELAFRACGDVSARFVEMTEEQRAAFSDQLELLITQIQTGDVLPYMLFERSENGSRPYDICYIPITQYGSKYELRQFDSFSMLIEQFYLARSANDRMRQKTHDLTRAISSARDRVRRKVATQRQELETAKNRERLRQTGDLLMANLQNIRRGQRSVTVYDFYDPEGSQTEIKLDPRISPQENAAKYYKDYARMKNAEKILAVQIAQGEHEYEYLESVLEELSRAESERDIQEIREELQNTGYSRRIPSQRSRKQAAQPPREFLSSGGFTILAGRNNLQNDLLTLKSSHKNDIWFHVQKLPGAHVVIRCNGEEPDDATYTEAASIAAYYSRARNGQNVPVDYTRIRYVKKPGGARPGMVVYDPYFTAYTTPNEELIESLRVDGKKKR